MLVRSEAEAAWRLQTAIGLANRGAIRDGVFVPSRDGMPGDLEHLAECLMAARQVLISEAIPWPWLYTSVGLAHARAGRARDALECWRHAEPMLATISGRRLDVEHPDLSLDRLPPSPSIRDLARRVSFARRRGH
ncbi:hypothetical protein [Pseudonocardia spinosispora]|uniref:hypothetical protein n=1 Tax=Pseudonocardia spinosispora TaxID=103441 RepID=UPI000407C5A2|nr:hypothetical protein [Pseudonocardia spinosispora]